MRKMNLQTIIGAVAGGLLLAGQATAQPTAAMEDFRAVWFTTVSGLDFPAGEYDIEEQRDRIIDLLDGSQAVGINAVIFQVRGECDAYYPSDIEPWSRWLTGTQGTAPARLWDPLQFMIDECRRRGMEIHAWFNPYRAGVSRFATFSSDHPKNDRPELVETFGNYYWLNPGHPDTVDYSLSVIMDVVNRYDIDGIHFDDYFYPYGIDEENPFPDTAEYNDYINGGGLMALGDWRRDNVNKLIEAIHDSLAETPGKSHVRFGISPFGIWKSGTPPGIVGMNAYNAIFADSRKWIFEGWLDYICPQIYWGMAEDGHPTGQDFDTLLDWWTNSAQNPLGHPVFAGLASYKSNDSGWDPQHIVNEVLYTQSSAAKGNAHFRTLHLTMNNGQGIGNATDGYLSTLLKNGPYATEGTTPAYTHMDSTPPGEPVLAWSGSSGAGYTVYWTPQASEYPQWYVVYWQNTSGWNHHVVPDWQRSYAIPGTGASAPTNVAVQALDRLGNRSTMTSTSLAGVSPAIPPQLVSTSITNFEAGTIGNGYLFYTGSPSPNIINKSSVVTTEENNNRLDPRVGNFGSRSSKNTFSLTNPGEGLYRLSTFNGTGVPNPAIDLTKGLGFYVKLLDGELDVSVYVRETGGSGPIGSNGGATGSIEVAQYQRVKASPNWQYLYFDIPNEQYSSVTGNGVLDGSWGVFEAIALRPVSGDPTTSFRIYIDDIHQGAAHTPLGEPVRPSGIEAVAAAASVELNWNTNPSIDIAKFRVYRATTPDVDTTEVNRIAEVGAGTPFYNDGDVTQGVTYYYAVTAVDQFGYESAAGPEVSATPEENSGIHGWIMLD